MLYQGYRPQIFYWEFVNTLKKFILIGLNVFLSRYDASYKGMTAVITIIILLRLQMWLKPYKLKVNNEIENASMVAILFTVFGGLLFIRTNNEVVILELLVFFMIIIINLVYFLFWIYLMSKTYEHYNAGKKLATVLKIMLLREDNDTIFTTDSSSKLSSKSKSTSKHKRQRLMERIKGGTISLLTSLGKNNEKNKRKNPGKVKEKKEVIKKILIKEDKPHKPKLEDYIKKPSEQILRMDMAYGGSHQSENMSLVEAQNTEGNDVVIVEQKQNSSSEESKHRKSYQIIML